MHVDDCLMGDILLLRKIWSYGFVRNQTSHSQNFVVLRGWMSNTRRTYANLQKCTNIYSMKYLGLYLWVIVIYGVLRRIWWFWMLQDLRLIECRRCPFYKKRISISSIFVNLNYMQTEDSQIHLTSNLIYITNPQESSISSAL